MNGATPKPQPPPTKQRRKEIGLKGNRRKLGPSYRRSLIIKPMHQKRFVPTVDLDVAEKVKILLQLAHDKGIIDDPDQIIELTLTYDFAQAMKDKKVKVRDGPIDLDGDGKISEAEREAFEKEKARLEKKKY
tara:strand:+ start:3334 stop:3729 length:396 start_codon:yes stop_codon:yes gene_type:complete|eukprot:g4171.t1